MISRFRDNDELRHSVRSAYKFGSHVVRKIHISTADAIEQSLWERLKRSDREREEMGEAEVGDNGEGDVVETLEVKGEEAALHFKCDRQDFDRWMEYALKHGNSKPEPVIKMEDDKYIVADDEPPARTFVPKTVEPGEEAGQVSIWLDRSPATREKIDVAHHSTFFKNKDNLPVYCSVAIESQIYHIPDLSEVTPHYGLIFQMNPAFTVIPYPRDFANVRSWSILKEIEALWPEAFLQTEKSHFRSDYEGNTVSTMFMMAHYTIERLHETQLRSFWRYRVDRNGNGNFEWDERWALVSLIEEWNASGGEVNRERTGQVVNHSPQFLSGFKDVLRQTGYGETQDQPAVRYVFSGMEDFPFPIQSVDTSKTIIHMNRTEAQILQKPSTDYAVMPADRTCIFDLDFCLGPLFLNRQGTVTKKVAEKTFKRLAFEEFHCGDCLLQIAMQSDRGTGMNMFPLPHATTTTTTTVPPATTFAANLRHHRRDHSTQDDVRQRLQDAKSSIAYSEYKRGVSAVLPSESIHPKARLRIIQDLYRYNFVIGESDSFFVTRGDLEKTQGYMWYLGRIRDHDKKLHVVCLNDGIVEEENGAEVRALLNNFLEDRYGDPMPWEKKVDS
ncbi:Xanthine phosphoribosyltransferase 1 [Mortierella sp. NVP41]|nr:Xanthine phosphoribosyltransferase 1 [Mortierella sp. NVP41]